MIILNEAVQFEHLYESERDCFAKTSKQEDL